MRSFGAGEGRPKVRSKQRVMLVGVELEGGWTAESAKKFVEKREDGVLVLPFHHDASLRDEPVIRSDHYGELVSKPMTPDEAEKWMRRSWPDTTNTWCGFHVHASFRTPTDYRFLMEEEFYKYFMKEMAELGRKLGLPKEDQYWHRLAGKNRYCLNKFRPDVQVHLKTKRPLNGPHGEDHPRRTILNYCYDMHKTLECRVFPLWEKADLGVKAMKGLLEIYNTYLNAKWAAGATPNGGTTKLTLKKDMTFEVAQPARPRPTYRIIG